MRARNAVLACLSALALGGCAGHTHNLVQNNGDHDIMLGTFRHEGAEGTAMVLEFRGVRFEARGFTIERTQNLAALRQRYGAGKHYDQVFSGMDTDHYVYSAQPVLRAINGATLRCSAEWRAGGSPAGHCMTRDGFYINFRHG